MQKRNETKQKQMRGLTVSMICIAVIAISLCVSMYHRSRSIIISETKRSLAGLSRQAACKINQHVAFDLDKITHLSTDLSLMSDDKELCSRYLDSVTERSTFNWIGFTDASGRLTVSGRKNVSMEDDPAIKSALRGETSVGLHKVEVFDGEEGILFASPLYTKDKIAGATVGWVSADTLEHLMDTEVMDGVGYSHIICSKGDYIIHPDNKSSLLNHDNFFNEVEEQANIISDNSLSDVKHDMMQRNSGSIDIVIDGKHERNMYYTPLAYGDWYLLSAVDPDAYSAELSSYTDWAIFATVIISALFLLLILLILRSTGKKNAEIARIAYTDSITGGFTSARFELELEHLKKHFHPFAFISMDIRKFKLINDSFGSAKGNRVLKHVFDTVSRYLKDGEFISRISSDTFNLVLNTTNQSEIRQRLEEITNAANAFNDNLEFPYFLPVDYGIYMTDDRNFDVITIRDRSNSARKTNKHKGDQRLCTCVFYNDLELLHMQREKEIENSMEHALENNEFVIYLQPKVSLNSSKIAGAEALVRWNSPDKGLIPPGDFIPFFEKNGFITRLDLYVFESVCKLLRKWIDLGINPMPISVNLSRNHLQQPDFLVKFKNIQDKYDIPPELLELELTETIVFENLEALKQVISEIHRLGFRCSMDDFGSGYSSLAVLKEVPVDILKLDRTFFDKENDPRGNDVVETVIELAKKLGMTTVAEGVETIPQVDFLRTTECDIVQGFVFSRPVPVNEFEKTWSPAHTQAEKEGCTAE